jgi:hypothetical protein
MFGWMKIAESASAVQRSVTKDALITACQSNVRVYRLARGRCLKEAREEGRVVWLGEERDAVTRTKPERPPRRDGGPFAHDKRYPHVPA